MLSAKTVVSGPMPRPARTTARAAEGLGTLGDVLSGPAAMTRRVAELLRALRRRSQLASRAWHTVDGQGLERVLDALSEARTRPSSG